MAQYTTTGGGYTLKWVEPELVDKITYTATATAKVGVKLAGAAERLYIRDILVSSPDCTDTNNIIANFYIKASNAASDGAATTTTVAIADFIGGTKLITKDAGQTYRIPASFIGTVGQDLICDLTVAAGTPTFNVVAYYKIIT